MPIALNFEGMLEQMLIRVAFDTGSGVMEKRYSYYEREEPSS